MCKKSQSSFTTHLHLQLLKPQSIYKPMVTANQASIYLPFCQFDYILPLVVCSHILYVVIPIAAMLHIISYDLKEAVSECQSLIRYFETERNDNSVYKLYMMKLSLQWSNLVLSRLSYEQQVDNEIMPTHRLQTPRNTGGLHFITSSQITC